MPWARFQPPPRRCERHLKRELSFGATRGLREAIEQDDGLGRPLPMLLSPPVTGVVTRSVHDPPWLLAKENPMDPEEFALPKLASIYSHNSRPDAANVPKRARESCPVPRFARIAGEEDEDREEIH